MKTYGENDGSLISKNSGDGQGIGSSILKNSHARPGRPKNLGLRTPMRPPFCACVYRQKPGLLAPHFPYTSPGPIAGTSPGQSWRECQVSFRWPARTNLPDP